MKKFISTIIALAMVMAMLPMTMASAAEPTDVAYWETKVANMELENAAAGKTFYGTGTENGQTIITEVTKATDGRVAVNLNKDADGGYGIVLYQWINEFYGKIDLGKKDDIKGLGIYRWLHDGCLDAIKFYGSDEDLSSRADILETATLLGTIAEDTVSTAGSTGAVAVDGDYSFRYVYMITEGTKCTHINEVYVYSEIEYMPKNLTAGLTGIDNNNAEVKRYTDGSNIDTSTPLNGWVKYDLGANYDLKYLSYTSNAPYTSNWWWQDQIYVKAGTTDNIDEATTLIGADRKSISQGRKMPLNGKYRYIWLGADSDMLLSKFNVYGYPVDATETTIEFENYTDKFADAYGVTPIESSSYGVTLKTDPGYVAGGNIINHTRPEYLGNDKAVYLRSVPATESKTIEIPVKITGDGWYSADAQLGGAGAQDGMSNATMTLVDAEGNEIYVLDRDYQNSEVSDYTGMRRIAPCHATYTYGYSGQTNYIKKGDYTLKVTVAPLSEKATLILDYLKLTPVTATEVKADAKTTIEMEKFDIQYANAIYTNASGGRTLYSTYGTAKSGKANVYNIPVNVDKAGYYDISTVMNKRISNSYSTVSVAVNGEMLYDNAVAGEATELASDGTHTGGWYEMNKYTDAVKLPAGENVITMTVSAASNLHRFAADCITIEKDTTPREAVIQFEDYADSITKAIAPVGTVATDRTYTGWNGSGLTNGQFGRYIGTGVTGHLNDVTYVARLSDGIPAEPGYVEFDIPVNIYVGGYYQTTMNIGGGTSLPNSSEFAAELVDASGNATPIIYTEGSPEGTGRTRTGYSPYSGVQLTKVDGPVNYLEEGEYTLKFRLYGYKTNISVTGNDLLFCGDWLKITPAVPYELTDGELKVEWENIETANSCKYVEKDIDTKVDADGDGRADNDYVIVIDVEGKASNDGVIYNDYGSTTEQKTVVNNFLIDVAEAGKYSVESVMAKYTGGRSLLTLKVNGETVYTNQGDGINVSDTDGDGIADFLNSNYSMRKYTGKVLLNEGINEVALEIQAYSSDSRVKYAADYVSFAPYVENPISQSKVTRIEAETYADAFAKAFGQTSYDEPAKAYALPTGSAVAKYIPTTDVLSGNAAMWAKAIETDAVMEVPVTVTEAGTYKAKLRIGANGANSAQAATAGIILVDKDGNEYKMGDTIFPDLKYSGGYPDGARKDLLEPAIYASGGGIFSGYTGTAYVPAGEYTAKIVIPAGKYSYTTISEVVNEETKEKEKVETVNNINKPMVLDYIEFMAAAPVVKAGEVAEAEDYFNVGEAEKAGFASGDKYSYTSWAYSNAKTIEYTIPVEVEAAGYYDVEAAMHYATGGNTTNIVVSVGGIAVYNNTKSGEDISDTDGDGKSDYYDHWFPMHKYVGNKVKLEAGINNIVFTMKRTNDNAYKHAIDYVKLTKSEDEMFIDGNEVVIKANYGKAVSGQAYMAFYKSDKLVEVGQAGSVNTSETDPLAEVAADQPSEEYDYVKLLVWGENAVPSIYAIGFNN